MKMMQGALRFPWSKRSRTRDAPTPTNISTKSLPLMLKNGTPASPATALASRVLPVPGGPRSSAPFGMRPPSVWNFFGSRRNSMISCSSSFASSAPATSRKVTLTWFSFRTRARDFPNLSAAEPPDCICRRKKTQISSTASSGIMPLRRKLNHGVFVWREVIRASGFFSRTTCGSSASSAGR